MKRSKIITVDRLTLDLSRIKAIKVESNEFGSTTLIVDLNARYEYVFSPQENKYNQVGLEDRVKMLYPNLNQAYENMQSWLEEWQNFMDSQVIACE